MTTTKKIANVSVSPKETKDTIHTHYAFIAPSAKYSQTAQADIDEKIAETAQRIQHKAVKEDRHVNLHIIAGKRSNKELVEFCANTPRVTVQLHTPDYKLNNDPKPGQTGREPFITGGKIVKKAINGVIEITGRTPARTKVEDQIINAALKKDRPVYEMKITPTPTREDQIAPKALPHPRTAYRPDLHDFPSWHALLISPETRSAGNNSQAPIYCGRLDRAAKAKGIKTASPLANPYKGENAIQDFRDHLWKLIKQKDRPILDELAKIDRETPLVCWCHAKKPCHTDVIRSAALYLRQEHAKVKAREIAERDAKRKAETPAAIQKEIDRFMVETRNATNRINQLTEYTTRDLHHTNKSLAQITHDIGQIKDHYDDAINARKQVEKLIVKLAAAIERDDQEERARIDANQRAAAKREKELVQAENEKIAAAAAIAAETKPEKAICSAITAKGSKCTRDATRHLHATDNFTDQRFCTQHANAWIKIAKRSGHDQPMTKIK